MISNGREYTSAEWLAEMRAMETEDCCELDSEILPPPPVAAAAETQPAAPTSAAGQPGVVRHLHARLKCEEDAVDLVELLRSVGGL